MFAGFFDRTDDNSRKIGMMSILLHPHSSAEELLNDSQNHENKSRNPGNDKENKDELVKIIVQEAGKPRYDSRPKQPSTMDKTRV